MITIVNIFWAALYQQLAPLLTHDALIKVLSVDMSMIFFVHKSCDRQ